MIVNEREMLHKKNCKRKTNTLFLYRGNVKVGLVVMLLYYLQGILLRLMEVITT